jgi:protein arginine kinase
MTTPQGAEGGPLKPFADQMTEWLRSEGNFTDVVLSSRARLARNISGIPFGTRASRDQRMQSLLAARAGIEKSHVVGKGLWCMVHEVTTHYRNLLVERHLISKQLAKGKGGSSANEQDPRAVAVSLPDERLSVMVNEEDHLRIQVIRSGLALGAAWKQIDAVDDALGAHLDFAFSPRFGYLTACPTNVGTGLRMSVMLHLPGLRITGEIDKVRRAADDMSLAVRGFYGEGSTSVGDLYQISNQTTLGKSEAQTLEMMENEIIPSVVEYERASRRELFARRRVTIEDQVMRAWGLLTNARLLGTEESMQALSLVRLGVLHEVIRDQKHQPLDVRHINQLFLLAQAAHLQAVVGKELDQEHRKAARATLVRTRLTLLTGAE